VRLRQLYTFHVVPNMNPDGAVRGHLRTLTLTTCAP
jgi:murein tripeptide amidase MpaA